MAHDRDDVVVALDVGGTGMKGALVSRDGRVRHAEDRRTPVTDGPAGVLDALRGFARDLQDRSDDPVLGAGVTVPGLVDAAAGIARYAANLGWRDVPVARLVAVELGVPVRLDHDVRRAGVAEGVLGGARGVRDWLFVPIGTGIAAALTVAGRMQAGATGAAGELGHVAVYPDGELCPCGQRGCLEAYASAAAIARRYVAAGGQDSTAEAIAGRLDTDPLARRVWDDACAALGVALAGYTMIGDPELILLGGGLSRAGEALFEPVRRELAGRLAWRAPPPIRAATLGAEAGRLGAALLGWAAAGDRAAARGAGWSAQLSSAAPLSTEPGPAPGVAPSPGVVPSSGGGS